MIRRSIWPCILKRLKVMHICVWIMCFAAIRLLLIPASGASASEIQSPLESLPSSTIRVGTYLITVPVSVTDASGKAIRGLNMGDFRLTEDGNPQIISRIAEAHEIPLRLGLLFDLSGSLNSRFEFEQQAAMRFLRKVWKDGDAACVIAFNEQPQVLLKRSVFISEVLQELSALKPTEDSTAFFNSVVLSARHLSQLATPETRQVLVVLSDGADNRSDRNLINSIEEVQRSSAIFYAINPSAASVRLNEINIKGQENLASLAAATGGTAFVSNGVEDLEDIFNRIAVELRAQYVLAYYSSNSLLDGRYRKIRVTIPDRQDLYVRARQGYYALAKETE